MPVNLKELIVVLAISSLVFWLARSIAPLFFTSEDFTRRRNVWYALTVAAFLSPSFWLFAIVAIPIITIAGRKDSNPSAFYLMLLQVIPPIDVPVPMIGMAYLFNINNYLLLSFCVMTPAAIRIIRSKDKVGVSRLGRMDYCLLGYGLLTAVLYIHTQTPDGGLYPSSITESLRRGFVFVFTIFIPYFAISRGVRSRSLLIDSMAALCLNCALLSGIAVFESARHWLLYGEMAGRWGDTMLLYELYITRGSSLRAMASTGHAMALGQMLVIAFGFWLYLQSRITSKRSRFAGTGILWGGLMAAYTRGAWIGGVLVYFVFVALQPRALSKLFKAAGAAVVIAVLISLTPLGHRIVSVLPFFGGQVDNFNVVYRQRLFDRSWQVIQESPMLGDQAALLKMQDLRQGEGIIDLVNTYMGILLENGFVGMTLFLSFILIALARAWSFSRKTMQDDPDLGLMGASLVSCIIATLVIIENESFSGVTVVLFYSLAALAVAYASLSKAWQLNPKTRSIDVENSIVRH
jgi:O-antigen ligase